MKMQREHCDEGCSRRTGDITTKTKSNKCLTIIFFRRLVSQTDVFRHYRTLHGLLDEILQQLLLLAAGTAQPEDFAHLSRFLWNSDMDSYVLEQGSTPPSDIMKLRVTILLLMIRLNSPQKS